MLNLSDDEYAKFHNALTFTIKYEGGYVNDPKDPGGETKWGISKRYHPNEDIKNLTPERAAEIYYDQYWKPAGCYQLDHPLYVVVFDSAVLCGVSAATTWLRKSSGDIPAYLELRRQKHLNRVKERPDQERFINGWLNRVQALKKYSEQYK